MTDRDPPPAEPEWTWSTLPSSALTPAHVHALLASADSDVWAAAASLDRVADSADVEREILGVGLQRTERAVQRARGVLQEAGEEGLGRLLEGEREGEGEGEGEGAEVGLLLRLRKVLLQRSDRLRTWTQMAQVGAWDPPPDGIASTSSAGAPRADTEEEEEEEDDAWGADDEPDGWDGPDPNLTLTTDPGILLPPEPSQPPSAAAAAAAAAPAHPPPPLPLPDFLLNPLLQSALSLATQRQYLPLQVLLHRHPQLWPYRFHVLDSVPEWEEVGRYQGLLPGWEWEKEREARPGEGEGAWRPERDFVERPEVAALLQLQSQLTDETAEAPAGVPRHDEPLSGAELSAWYASRVERIDALSGSLDQSLALVQHGASLGLPGLDALGEDLSLLSRLVYDAPPPRGVPVDYTLADWRRMTPAQVVRAYLAGSTPATIAGEVRRLVLPYLYVLEARSERAGTPDPALVRNLLYGYLLSAPLELALPLFEHSKPTLHANQRIVRSDEDVARLALAYLYGEDRVAPGDWSAMSRIFECLPAWPNVSGAEQMDEAETTLSSLAAFVTPSTAARPGPEDLLLFFAPLPRSALTHLLDVLDLHLESGEILARWACPAPLRWFLQAKDDRAAQRGWAVRLTRGVARRVGPDGGEGEWKNLWEDMEKLAGDDAADEEADDDDEEEDAWGGAAAAVDGGKGLKPAFGLVGRDEVARIFFAGLLSSGNFKLARKMLMPAREPWPLGREAIEELVLAASHEFYDNAESGNLHSGDMRLAYECLNVAQPSPAIVKEHSFIEATSRLCSYNLVSRSGNPISPIEIRLTKDKLSLIARLLSSADDMYKQSGVILELVDKLGFAGDEVAHIKALAMIATTALQSEDFAAAATTVDAMLARTFEVKVAEPKAAKDPDSQVFEAITVCWQTCFQLGGQSEYRDSARKMSLLSNALKLCPAENISDVLSSWRKVEAEVESVPLDKALLSLSSRAKTSTSYSGDILRHALSNRPHALLPNLGDIHLPSSLVNQETAAMAARTFNRVAANFTFPGSRGRTSSVMSDDESVRSGSPDLGRQARSVFTRGVGWLIGADDQELQ
ncbi:hypothetical protein CALCODRAFT_496182 [Calocera cornea HHB12733]|uniref:Sec39 domain-containing protein n=1 Tax=Calocera cornea HHB12733 TaxID=1353952 RepID=A0A165FYT6_9BASI|nr:hypothetical protein CALCODRAFT_496182 [Calocera cornea HHB12733]